MGGKWSFCLFAWGHKVQTQMRQNPPEATASGAGSQDLHGPGAITSMPAAAADAAWLWLEAHEGEEVGFPVRPVVPLRPMTYKGAFDLGFFLKEKGGLVGLIYSKKKQNILDLWVYHTQGYFPDCYNYAPGPGFPYPLGFGWCFKLVPLDPRELEKENKGEDNCLLHPLSRYGMEDEDREVLMCKFDSALARIHIARQLDLDFYRDC
uniref:Protein Nef n=1 Tax=Human immunodeficiency virus type 1 TaxID=11676 RepID=G9BQW6_HV1|nr:nef protein [Human immunodeficiency virus 1]